MNRAWGRQEALGQRDNYWKTILNNIKIGCYHIKDNHYDYKELWWQLVPNTPDAQKIAAVIH